MDDYEDDDDEGVGKKIKKEKKGKKTGKTGKKDAKRDKKFKKKTKKEIDAILRKIALRLDQFPDLLQVRIEPVLWIRMRIRIRFHEDKNDSQKIEKQVHKLFFSFESGRLLL
jgi:hypothetical protein